MQTRQWQVVIDLIIRLLRMQSQKQLDIRISGSIEEPGHFVVRKSSSQVTRSQGRSQDFLWGCTFWHFFLKKLTYFFSRRPQNTGRRTTDCFTVKIKQIKRPDMVTFLFSVYTIIEAMQ